MAPNFSAAVYFSYRRSDIAICKALKLLDLVYMSIYIFYFFAEAPPESSRPISTSDARFNFLGLAVQISIAQQGCRLPG